MVVGPCVLTQMASIHTQQTVRSITSVHMEQPMSTPVHLAFFGMILSKIAIGLQMLNATLDQLLQQLLRHQ